MWGSSFQYICNINIVGNIFFPGEGDHIVEPRVSSGETESASVPTNNLSENNKQLSASQGSLRSMDNDSSATMSADEGMWQCPV